MVRCHKDGEVSYGWQGVITVRGVIRMGGVIRVKVGMCRNRISIPARTRTRIPWSKPEPQFHVIANKKQSTGVPGWYVPIDIKSDQDIYLQGAP